MKRVKFSYNSTFMKLSDDTVNAAFSESVKFVELLVKIARAIPDLQALEKTGDTDGFMDSSFWLLDDIIDNDYDKLRAESLAELCDYPIASTDVLLRRAAEIGRELHTGKEGLTSLLSRAVTNFCDEYSFPSGENLEFLRGRIQHYLGQLGYFIYYQYGLHKVSDTTVTEPVYQFCMKDGRTPEELANFWSGVIKEFRPRLSVFEEYPELEEAFWDVAGPYMDEFDLFEDYLTKDDVVAILTPNADISELLGKVILRGGRG